jgi:hypothetical protein
MTYGGSVEKKKNKVNFKMLFNKPELDPPAPKKLRIVHFYSRCFYHEHVKDCVTVRWAALSKLPNPPKEITVRNQVTKECWEAEDPAFQDEVRAALGTEERAKGGSGGVCDRHVGGGTDHGGGVRHVSMDL